MIKIKHLNMKRLTLILMTLVLTGSSFAQADIEFNRKLWNMWISPATYDDSHLRESLPLVFGPNGKYFFNQFVKCSDRASFSKDSIDYREGQFDDYYQTHIVGFEFDSIATDHYTSAGDVREVYVFYNEGVELKSISLLFIEGIQFLGLSDRTTDWEPEPIIVDLSEYFDSDDLDE
jgi:hypothetical protein